MIVDYFMKNNAKTKGLKALFAVINKEKGGHNENTLWNRYNRSRKD